MGAQREKAVKRFVIRIEYADDDALMADRDNHDLALVLEGVIGPALLGICDHVGIESVTVEDVPEQAPISIAALVRRDVRGA